MNTKEASWSREKSFYQLKTTEQYTMRVWLDWAAC